MLQGSSSGADDRGVSEATVTDADRAAARDDVNRAARGTVCGLFVLVCLALVFSEVAERAAGGNVAVGIGITVIVVGPLLLLVAFGAKKRGIDDTAQRLANERSAQVEAERRAFGTQLHNALEMTNAESEALDLAQEALCRVSGGRHGELLLADNSHARLERVAAVDADNPHCCPVTTPEDCVAARRGHLAVFPDAAALDACPKVKQRRDLVFSAVCVPVAVLGRTVGVVHVASLVGEDPADADVGMLQVLANQLGSRLGMLRVLSETSLQASTDSLTGLWNRRRLEAAFNTLLARRAPLAVVLADLDDFKELNDRYGHDAGDRALRAFASALREEVRQDDLVCRYGGEEFVVVLPGRSIDDARAVFERVRQRVSAVASDGRVPAFTASYGITDSEGVTPLDELLAEADVALYEAKAAGKNTLIGRRALRALGDVEEPATTAVSAGW